MAKYAEGTTVPADRSRAEIERTLTRFGATAFAYGWSADRDQAQIMFELAGRRMRFVLPLPASSAKDITHTPTGQRRTEAAKRSAYDTEVKRGWRALGLVIKAKLEAVATGIVSSEQEFLAHVVLPSGETVGDWVQPQLQELYGRGDMPALLPGAGDRNG